MSLELPILTRKNGCAGYYTLFAPSNYDELEWEESMAEPAFSNNEKVLRQRMGLLFDNVQATNIIRDIIFASQDLKNKSYDNKRIVYITDHSIPADYSTFESSNEELTKKWKAAYGSVPVYFVCIGDFDRANLERIASETKGRVFTVATLNELYSEFDPKLIFPEAKNSDDDSFSDNEETYGLIVNSAGRRIKTNPEDGDTDSDGLKDSEEVEVNRTLEKGKDKYGKEVYKWYHHMNSDPTNEDSDGDGLDDKLDNDPLDSKVHAFVIYETTANDSDLKVWLPDDDDPNDKTIEHKYPDDLRYADKDMSDLLSTKYITRNDFLFSLPYVNEIYKKGLVDEYTKILIDYHKKGLIDFIEWPSMGEMEEVAKDMVEHFLSGSGEDYRNDILSKRIAKHENTKKVY